MYHLFNLCIIIEMHLYFICYYYFTDDFTRCFSNINCRQGLRGGVKEKNEKDVLFVIKVMCKISELTEQKLRFGI